MPEQISIDNLKPYSKLQAIFWSILTFIFITTLVLVGWINWRRTMVQEQQLRLSEKFELAQTEINNRLNSFLDILRAAKALFVVSEIVTRGEWREFAEAVDIRGRFGDGTVMTFNERVFKKDLDDFLDKAVKEHPGFKIHPFADKDEYFIVRHVEPEEGRESSLGFELGSDPLRLKAVLRARDTGEPAATPVTFSPVTGEPFVSIYLAIYQKITDPKTLNAKIAAFDGMVFVGFRVKDFFERALSDVFDDMDVKVYDDGIEDNKHLIFDKGKNFTGGISKKSILAFANHAWAIVVSAPADFGLNRIDKISSPIILAGGISLAILSAVLIYLMLISRSRAINLALHSLEESKRSVKSFSAIASQSRDLVMILDSLGFLELINSAAENSIGYAADELVGKKIDEIGIASPEEVSLIKEKISAIVNNKKIQPLDIKIKDQGGKELIINASFSLVDRDKVLILARDVTERRRFEDDLKLKNEELTRLNKLLVGRELKMVELKNKLEENK